jgi:hypothetical protein
VINFVLYGCKTLSLSLREEHRLRVLVNRALTKIFVLEREDVAGGWRRLHNEELHNLYMSPNVIRVIKSTRIKWVGHVVNIGEVRNA